MGAFTPSFPPGMTWPHDEQMSKPFTELGLPVASQYGHRTGIVFPFFRTDLSG
jgi:hypothetical protein